MNISEKVKHVWWASMRCGSRSVSDIMKFYDFYNYETKQDIYHHPFSHSCQVPPEFLDYKIVMQVRNPYSRALSYWHLYSWKEIDGKLFITESFEDYVFSNKNITDHYENSILQYKPYYFIRYETLSKDVLNLSFLEKREDVLENYKSRILNNVYVNEGIEAFEGALKRDERDSRYADWKSYFNQKIAGYIYEKCAMQFELLNYDKNSWKT